MAFSELFFFSCRTHHNFARKQNFLAEHIKILPGSLEIRKIGLKFHKFCCRTHFYLLNRLKFDNYMNNSSCRTPPKLPGVSLWEHMFSICCSLAAFVELLSIFQNPGKLLIRLFLNIVYFWGTIKAFFKGLQCSLLTCIKDIFEEKSCNGDFSA